VILSFEDEVHRAEKVLEVLQKGSIPPLFQSRARTSQGFGVFLNRERQLSFGALEKTHEVWEEKAGLGDLRDGGDEGFR